MLPTWGSYWKFRGGKPGLFTLDGAGAYGRFLGRRYREKPIIWILILEDGEAGYPLPGAR